jgi:hypothetical protein
VNGARLLRVARLAKVCGPTFHPEGSIATIATQTSNVPLLTVCQIGDDSVHRWERRRIRKRIPASDTKPQRLGQNVPFATRTHCKWPGTRAQPASGLGSRHLARAPTAKACSQRFAGALERKCPFFASTVASRASSASLSTSLQNRVS